MLKRFIILCFLFSFSVSFAYKKDILDNGMTVIKEKRDGSPVVSVQLFVKTGSNNESDDQWGMTHVLEHLVFKGTRKRAPGQIAKEVQSMGGYINAFTSYGVTSYYITLPRKHVKKALDIIFDMAFFPTIDSEELEKEKPVIIEEINMRADSASSIAFEGMMSGAYPVNRIGKRVIGTPEHVKSFTSSNLTRYHQEYYKPNNSILSICGDYDEVTLNNYIKELSKDIEKGRLYNNIDYNSVKQVSPNFVSHVKKDISQLSFYMGFRIPEYKSLDTPALDILSTMLGSGSSSRLYKHLKVDKQIVNSISCGVFSGNHPGIFIVSGTLPVSQNISEVLIEIHNVISEIKKEGPDDKEFLKILNNLRATKEYDLEDPEGYAREMGYFEVLGSIEDKEIYERALSRLSSKDIAQVAEKYLTSDRLTFSICVPETIKIDTANVLDKISSYKSNEMSEVKGSTDKHKTQEFFLENGAKVILSEDHSLSFVSFGAFWQSPFSYETRDNNGISLMSSSLASTATKKMNRELLSEYLEENAITLYPSIDKNIFSFRGKCLSDKVSDMLSVFVDMVYSPRFSVEDYLKEKKNIVEQLKTRMDDAGGYAAYIAESQLFGEHYYGLPLSGEISTVEKTSLVDIKKWYTRHITDVLPVLVFAGDITKEDIIELVKIKGASQTSALQSINYPQSNISIHEKLDKEQHTLLIKYPAPEVGSKDFYSMKVLTSILSGMGSRLFDSLRNEGNLVYTTYAYVESGRPSGAFSIYAGVKPGEYKKASDLIRKAIKELKDIDVTEEELKKAKNVINGGYISFMQKRDNIVTNYGRFEMLGMGWHAVGSYLDKINSVTAEDVKKVAVKYLSMPSVEVVVGP